MKTPITIFFALWLAGNSSLVSAQSQTGFANYAPALSDSTNVSASSGDLSPASIRRYLEATDSAALNLHTAALLRYKQAHQPDDWLFYQAVRKAAQQISPKTENYHRYTFYKWLLLSRAGYDVMLTCSGNYLLFYVQSNEAVYNIPYRTKNGRQYVCLNYHDYGSIDFTKNQFTEVPLQVPANVKSFSYKVTRLPDFPPAGYTNKEVNFTYNGQLFQFSLKLSPEVKTIFSNYPVVDYEFQCNVPLSAAAYQSLMPVLKKETDKLSVKDGVEFLMHFTRHAFSFKPDGEVHGSEKRFSPEQTLLYEYSDCEDRAALFFYLVKELYNLPMLVLTYPQHVTVAVQFEKGYGKTIRYNGADYSVCEPTPQKQDLRIGQLLPALKHQAYEVAYAYKPQQ